MSKKEGKPNLRHHCDKCGYATSDFWEISAHRKVCKVRKAVCPEKLEPKPAKQLYAIF